ncbi:neuronal acetylcholine receptor subunit alpha-10-like [Argopecten irradians]|uniref:neuronal acetylcholine receptor subunit alpha-10-like n=1 Tax=Argopecten irradians TaxID=31199 RepID=UPI00371E8A38
MVLVRFIYILVELDPSLLVASPSSLKMWKRFVINLLIVLVAAHDCLSAIPEQDILEDLFYSYNKHARPSTGLQHVVQISHSLTLTRIVSMEKGVMTADTWQMMKWQDVRISWDPDYYQQVASINIPDELIWTPDIILYNNAGATSGRTYASIRIIVSSDGSAEWIPGTRVIAYCDVVKSSDRPNVQAGDYKCPLKFGSWTYHEKTVNMTVFEEGLFLGDYNENPEYDIVDHDVVRETLNYTCCSEPYVSITYTIWLRRNCSQSVVNTDVCNTDESSIKTSSDDGNDHSNDDNGTGDKTSDDNKNDDSDVDDGDNDDTDDTTNDDTDEGTDHDDDGDNDEGDDVDDSVQPVVTT